MSELRAGPKRGRDVRKMDKPYKGREVIYTCSNGWTIERVIEDEFSMEAFFMGHCLSLDYVGMEVYSLREPDGTPHVTIVGNGDNYEFTGRCNMPPKESYTKLCQEFFAINSAVRG